MSHRTADKIQAPVNAVRAVDVGMAGRAEHHLITPGRTRKAVRGGIIVVISFCLYDPPANFVYKQGGAYEGARHLNGRGGKIDRWLNHAHGADFIQSASKNQLPGPCSDFLRRLLPYMAVCCFILLLHSISE